MLECGGRSHGSAKLGALALNDKQDLAFRGFLLFTLLHLFKLFFPSCLILKFRRPAADLEQYTTVGALSFGTDPSGSTRVPRGLALLLRPALSLQLAPLTLLVTSR